MNKCTCDLCQCKTKGGSMRKRKLEKKLTEMERVAKNVINLYFSEKLEKYSILNRVISSHLGYSFKPFVFITVVYEKYMIRIASNKLDVEVTEDTNDIVLDDALEIQSLIKKFEDRWNE